MVRQYLNETSTPSVLPFKLQEYLWQQTGNLLKVKLSPGGYESTCVNLERLICGYKTKELKVHGSDDIISAIESIPRWTFVKGSFPYVIQCCSAVLEQRRQLNMADKFSVAAMKLFATLHWILLESSAECNNDGIGLELNMIELFIQTIIPTMHNIYDSDLTFSLSNGKFLWRPLWNNSPPVGSLLALPVLDPAAKCTPKTRKGFDTTLQLYPKQTGLNEVATYFDVAVMKVLILENWTINGYRWGLQYLQHYLQRVLFRNGFDMENCLILSIMNKFSPRKSLGASLESGQDTKSPSRSDNSTQCSVNVMKIKLNEKVPNYLLDYVTPDGDLKLSYILQILKRLVKYPVLWSLSGSLLFLIAQLTELALDTHKIMNALKSHFESLLYCYVNITKMLGCEHHCRNRTRCVKGEQFRLLLHKYFYRLVDSDVSRSRIWFEKYVRSERSMETTEFIHSFLGFCLSTPRKFPADIYSDDSFSKDGALYTAQDGSFENDQQAMLQQHEYLEQKYCNEQHILRWACPLLYNNITEDWHNIKTRENVEYFSLIALLTKYLRTHHAIIFRNIVMYGMLGSFAINRNSKEKVNKISSEVAATSSDKPKWGYALKTTSQDIVANKPGKLKGKKNWFNRRYEKSTYEESMEESSVGSFPGTSSSLPHGPSTDSDYLKDKAGSLPRSFFKGKLKHEATVESLPSESTLEVSVLKSAKRRGKLIKTEVLYAGLKQLRCLLDLSEPGLIPEEGIVAAMLDLEAPVVARAAYLLELAYFVRSCNREQWPSLMQFAQQGVLQKGIPHRNLLIGMKHRAGLLFHKWGVAIGRKLDDLMIQEKSQQEPRSSEKGRIDFMYQGDASSLSSYCPHALRFIACQLLLEITAYLRETFVIAVQIKITSNNTGNSSPRSRTHTEVSHTSSGGRRPKHSIANSIAKKISAVQRRKSSVGYLLTSNEGNKEDPTSSPSSKIRRNSSLTYLTKKSPKPARKFSRKVSKASFDRQSSMLMDDHDEVPDEMLDFPWLNTLIQMNKSINFLCQHGDEKCPDFCPVEQVKSCIRVMEVLKTLYDQKVQVTNKKVLDISNHNSRIDPLHEYITLQVGKLVHAPFATLCKGAFVMDIQQLVETMAPSWEVLLYPCQQLKSAAASLFMVVGYRLESHVSNFLSRELTCSDAQERGKAIQRYSILWDCQYQVYQHLEESAKITLRIPMPRLEYTIPSRPIGEEAENVPDAPWVVDPSIYQDLDLSDDEDSFYYLDSQQQKESQAKKQAQKLKELREQYPLTTVPLAFQSSLEYDVQEEDDAVVISTDSGIQSFFPQSMSPGILHLIRLLDDTSVTVVNGQSVSGLAYQIIWKCLVDDPETFFQRFFEKITRLSKQDQLVLLLRKLLKHVPILPPNAAHMLFNNLIGLIVSFDHANRHGKFERIALVIPLLWQIVPSVKEIYFTDMNQSLRRENIDNILMVTANFSCVKELAVSYMERKERLGVIDEMTFKELLDQSKFDIFETDTSNLWLVDKYSGLIMEGSYKIRDTYPYRRGYPRPLLKLEELGYEHSFSKRQQQALTNKLIAISQLKLTSSIFDAMPNKKHVMFLSSELYQQPHFARKAFELEFDLCLGSELGTEIFGLDVILKNNWVQFISSLLGHLAELSHYGEEVIGIFLEPINGALLLHCEDVMILRTSLAALINIVMCYGKIFSYDGYENFLPILLKVYSHHEDNALVKKAVEFTVQQFYNYHRNHFILQMFASVAPILQTDYTTDVAPEEQLDLVPVRCLFALVASLDQDIPDVLDIMSLVNGEKPIKPFDNPLDDDAARSGTIDLSIRLALTIIAYRPESSRALQMMFVLSAILPHYLAHLAALVEANPLDTDIKKNERKQMKALTKYVAIIIEKNERLSQHYQREDLSNISNRGEDTLLNGNANRLWKSVQNAFSSVRSLFMKPDDMMQETDYTERTSVIHDGENPFLSGTSNFEKQQSLDEFYLPRTVVLLLASEFTLKCSERYQVLGQEGKPKPSSELTEIIDEENSLILLDIAISLITLVLSDQNVLLNAGLQRFLLEAMPCIDWKNNLKPFGCIIKQMVRIFKIILSRSEYMRYAEWNYLEILMRGLYLTLKKQEELAVVPDMMDLLHTCIKIVLDNGQDLDTNSMLDAGIHSPSSISFNTVLIKFSARLLFIQADEYNLEKNVSKYIQPGNVLQTERFLACWLLPLCIRMATGRFDYPSMSSSDVHFVSSALMSILRNNVSYTNRPTDPTIILTSNGAQGRGNMSSSTLTSICFLGLKILMMGYSDYFGKHWKEMKNTIVGFLKQNRGDLGLWNFLLFLVSHRLPLFVHLLPIVKIKIATASESDSSHLKQIFNRIKHDLSYPPTIGCRSGILRQLLNELSSLSHVRPTVLQEEEEETEDDQSYVARVMGELKYEQENSSDKLDRKWQHSIMKRTYTNPFVAKSHDKLKKQVSFNDESNSTKSVRPTLDFSGVIQGGSPIHRQIMKLSKRSKLRMLKQPKNAYDGDQEEIIVTNPTVGDTDDEKPATQTAIESNGVSHEKGIHINSGTDEEEDTSDLFDDSKNLIESVLQKNKQRDSPTVRIHSSAKVVSSTVSKESLRSSFKTEASVDRESSPKFTFGEQNKTDLFFTGEGSDSEKPKGNTLSRTSALMYRPREDSSPFKISGLPTLFPENNQHKVTAPGKHLTALHRSSNGNDISIEPEKTLSGDDSESYKTSVKPSKRSLPRLPKFDEERLVEMNRKLSEDSERCDTRL